MANRRGKAWDFPNPDRVAMSDSIKITYLEAANKKLQERVEQLEAELNERRIEVPEEILDAHIVEDLDNGL